MLNGPRALTFACLSAMAVGSALAVLWPEQSADVAGHADLLILSLVAATFFTVRLDARRPSAGSARLIVVAVAINFAICPVVALLATVLLPAGDLRLGVLLYCVAPCTDWFLGFTRLARGDTATGAALIPLQMVLQLALFPLWIRLFAGESGSVADGVAWDTVLRWFVVPAAIGVGARALLRAALPAAGRARIRRGVDRIVILLVAGIVCTIFAGNIRTVLGAPLLLAAVLGVVFLFFLAMFAISASAASLLRLDAPSRTLLAMTTSARNAPLMIALIATTLPNHPLVQTAIILGMLVEFPHLAALTHILRLRAAAAPRVRPSHVRTPIP